MLNVVIQSVIMMGVMAPKMVEGMRGWGRRHDIQRNDSQHNDTQHNVQHKHRGSLMMSVASFIIMLNVVMLTVFTLNVAAPWCRDSFLLLLPESH
jgi:hypothetical protein